MRRLADEQLDRLEQRIGYEFEDEATLTGSELRALLAEIRALRLSPDGVEALRWARWFIERETSSQNAIAGHALGILGRLLAAHGGDG